MKDINEIIDELMRHPHALAVNVFTVNDCVDYLNEQLADEYDNIAIDINDLTKNDIKVMDQFVSSNIDQIWKYVDISLYPDLDEFTDLHKKVNRQIKLLKIL